MLGDKLRFRFRKVGDLRLLSHHDLMRCLERMLRRAGIPFKSTAGFHPGPRVVFALSLPLGVVGTDEVLELELLQPCDSESVRLRMNAASPAGLEFTRAAVVPMKATAVPRRVEYALPLPADRAADVALRCAELLASEKVWVERQRPSPKRLNIRPYLRNLGVLPWDRLPACHDAGRLEDDSSRPQMPSTVEHNDRLEACPTERVQGEHVLLLDLWVTGTGTARADELLDRLGVREAGAVLERRTLEIRDEHPPDNPADQPPDNPADQPPDGPAESEPLIASRAAPAEERAETSQTAGQWNGPVVE